MRIPTADLLPLLEASPEVHGVPAPVPVYATAEDIAALPPVTFTLEQEAALAGASRDVDALISRLIQRSTGLLVPRIAPLG